MLAGYEGALLQEHETCWHSSGKHQLLRATTKEARQQAKSGPRKPMSQAANMTRVPHNSDPQSNENHRGYYECGKACKKALCEKERRSFFKHGMLPAPRSPEGHAASDRVFYRNLCRMTTPDVELQEVLLLHVKQSAGANSHVQLQHAPQW